MDEILVEALNQTPEGQAFTGLPEGASDEDTQTAWNAFTQALETGYHARLQSAAAGDAAATSAVTALTTYTSTTSRLAAGQIPEFKDEAQAEKDIKLGRTPEPNPEYQQSLDARTDAHVGLSTGMPHCPVTFGSDAPGPDTTNPSVWCRARAGHEPVTGRGARRRRSCWPSRRRP